MEAGRNIIYVKKLKNQEIHLRVPNEPTFFNNYVIFEFYKEIIGKFFDYEGKEVDILSPQKLFFGRVTLTVEDREQSLLISLLRLAQNKAQSDEYAGRFMHLAVYMPLFNGSTNPELIQIRKLGGEYIEADLAMIKRSHEADIRRTMEE